MRTVWIHATLASAVASLACSAALLAEQGARELFIEKRCDMCHSIESQNLASRRKANNASDLSKIGDDNDDPQWWLRYLVGEEVLDGDKHRRKYAIDEDLRTIVEWLLSISEPSPGSP